MSTVSLASFDVGGGRWLFLHQSEKSLGIFGWKKIMTYHIHSEIDGDDDDDDDDGVIYGSFFCYTSILYQYAYVCMEDSYYILPAHSLHTTI